MRSSTSGHDDVIQGRDVNSSEFKTPTFAGKIRIYLRFLQFITPYRRKLALVILLAFIGVPLGKVAPLVTKFLVDDVLLATTDTAEHRRHLLILLLALQAVCFFAGEYVRIVQSWIGSYFWMRLCVDLTKKVYGHMHRLSADFFQSRNVGEHIYRASSDITMQSTQGWMSKGGVVKLISDSIPSILLNLYSVLWAAVILYLVSPVLVLAVLLYMIPYSLGFMFFFEQLYQTSFAFQRSGQTNQSVLRDAMAGMKYLKSSGFIVAQERVVLGASVSNLRRGTLATFWHVMGRQAWIHFVVQNWTIGIWVYTSVEVLQGRMTIGEWSTIPMLVSGLRGPAENIVMYLLDLKMQTVPATRILQTLDLKPTVIEAPNAKKIKNPKGDIALDRVSFSFVPGQPILTDVSLQIPAGTSIGIVGPSGSGKSTLVNLMMRLYDPDSGSIRFDGDDLRELNLDSLLASFGVVPQSTFLFDGTIRDNISFGHFDATEEEILNAAIMAGLQQTLLDLPKGLDTYLGEGTMISGGQKQRIGLARALIRNPRVLILDESTSSLDAMAESLILSTVGQISKTRSVITVAHRLRAVMDCDVIVVLDAGRIVESGAHEELLKVGGTYAQMWSAQMADLDEMVASA